MKNKKIILFMILALLITTLVGCTKDSNEDQNSVSKTEQNQPIENSIDESNNTDKTDSVNATKRNEDIKEDDTTIVAKIEGRRKEFLERLDNIQYELDAMPDKEHSDRGVTNAMKNYYGISYETYDKELNEIYALLKEELSSEVMEDLKSKQIKWIEEKEEEANKAAEKYKGGTHENVARYVSLYNATKERCYELVNEYMTD
ncbi:uncharacterized protein DUF1311 [Natranaerovirga hydrolytica]|uniref:Uncharacterized protein DUF1311 n=1 Tax=Natranaerovirga hydrolytica TaxID=680378 RepID=A0A4R1M9V2_9FIRM|nr:lysozyme inhibitor LprI family protein [Natranaerovirga hydrolytica]TCK89136.1 uncharacterized protein DUF1311 [Natranaerovirga hydrolytica]